jgi:hypothetical protein
LQQQILWNKFHIRCAYFTPNCTWSLNYSVLVIPITHSPPAALRQGVARTVFDLVVDVMFNPIPHHLWPSDRVSRGQYSTSCEVMKSSLPSPSAALRQGVAQAVFDLVVNVNVSSSLHSPPAALRQGVARTVFYLVRSLGVMDVLSSSSARRPPSTPATTCRSQCRCTTS